MGRNNQPDRLYNLANDIQEKHDVAPQHPDRVQAMHARLQQIINRK